MVVSCFVAVHCHMQVQAGVSATKLRTRMTVCSVCLHYMLQDLLL